MNDPKMAAISKALQELIPGSAIQQSFCSGDELRDLVPNAPTERRSKPGAHIRPELAIFWHPLVNNRICIFRMSRFLPFTSRERNLLGYVASTLDSLRRPSEGMSRTARSAERVMTREAFTSVLTSRYVRGKKSGSTFYAPALVISLLQRLSFQKYEGQQCSSGFVYASGPPRLGESSEVEPYRLEKFREPVQLADTFFEAPGSHRYVDGRNGFYLFNNALKVYGVVRCVRPAEFSRAKRAVNAHLTPLLEVGRGKRWVALVGSNADVRVVFRHGGVLKWSGGSWTLSDPSLPLSVLLDEGLERGLAEDVLSTLLAISDMRLGTVLLIARDPQKRPTPAGRIDDSSLGQNLLACFQRRQFRELVGERLAFGLLTSDGLTTISRDGEVLGCGEIIAVQSGGAASTTGGGRTQAAVNASKHGLAIKVSEDGPVSFFREGRKILAMT